jgi:hypothetical protein
MIALDMFHVVKIMGYIEIHDVKKNIACGFNRRNAKNVLSDTFPVFETTCYI